MKKNFNDERMFLYKMSFGLQFKIQKEHTEEYDARYEDIGYEIYNLKTGLFKEFNVKSKYDIKNSKYLESN